MTVYDSRPDLRDVLCIAVSQSGGSPDLSDRSSGHERRGDDTGRHRCSRLTLASRPIHLDILAGPERAWPRPDVHRRFVNAVSLIEGLASGGADPAYLPERAATVLALEGEIEVLARRYRFADQLVVTARGYNYATARETALKLMETSCIVANAFPAPTCSTGPWP